MRRKRFVAVLAISLLSLIALIGCSEETESTTASTPTPSPTHTPVPTDTTVPTPTNTAAPPTSTPSGPTPTSQPKPTLTFTPEAIQPEPEATSPPATSPPATSPPPAQSNVRNELRTTMTNTRVELEHFGGMIDVALGAGRVDCQEVVDRYDRLAASPIYDVSSSPDDVRGAYDQYRRSIGIFTQGAKDMAQNCRDYLANPKPGGIPFQQWGVARQSVNDALDVLNPAIQMLQ
ncbi:MAG: hypothetical protein ACP5JG_16750 [Anaerolineae bacterium]